MRVGGFETKGAAVHIGPRKQVWNMRMSNPKCKANHWYSVRNQSLALFAREAGFDLAMYLQYGKAVQTELRKRAVKSALEAIDDECDSQDCPIYDIGKGVYVISLSNPLSIKYIKHYSQVIYIGRGNIMGRIKSHFELKLFDFMLSLSGADFDFHFSYPTNTGHGAKTADVNVEHLMLNYFEAQYGSFPILNKNAGTEKNQAVRSNWWKKHLRASGGRPKWKLEPTKHGEFPTLDS